MIRLQKDSIVTFEFASLCADEGLSHAIFGRHGGVSPAPWQSLNLSTSTGDSAENVSENHRRVYTVLGYTPSDAVISRQVHGNRVAAVGRAERGMRVPNCDALMTNEPAVVLLQRHADCPPIFLFDPQRRAVGVAHAGWRGTLANIAGAMVRAFGEAYGSRPSDLVAAIGPGIGACCYHVGADVQREFASAYDHAHLWLHGNGDGKVYLDLVAANRALLHEAGVQEVESADLCTACNVAEFYSARAENRRNGCFGAAIVLRG